MRHTFVDECQVGVSGKSPKERGIIMGQGIEIKTLHQTVLKCRLVGDAYCHEAGAGVAHVCRHKAYGSVCHGHGSSVNLADVDGREPFEQMPMPVNTSEPGEPGPTALPVFDENQ